MPQVAADEPGLSGPLTDGPRRATTTACSSGRANGCTKEPREDFADTPSLPSRSMAQTIPEPPSSLSASCRPRMPTLWTFDAGSPKGPIFATMPALRKKCSHSSTRPDFFVLDHHHPTRHCGALHIRLCSLAREGKEDREPATVSALGARKWHS